MTAALMKILSNSLIYKIATSLEILSFKEWDSDKTSKILLKGKGSLAINTRRELIQDITTRTITPTTSRYSVRTEFAKSSGAPPSSPYLATPTLESSTEF